MKNLIIKGNCKVGNKVYLFNLPPLKTCTPTKWCTHGRNGKPACYALRNNFLLSSVTKSLNERYELSKRNYFVDRMSNEINKAKALYFRIHSSGDFYSKTYVNKIHQIVKNCPNTLFRTTTRRLDLIKPIEKLNSLPNMIVRESLDYIRTKPVTKLNFTALTKLDIAKKRKCYLCKEDCEECGYYCWLHRCNVKFNEF